MGVVVVMMGVPMNHYSRGDQKHVCRTGVGGGRADGAGVAGGVAWHQLGAARSSRGRT